MGTTAPLPLLLGEANTGVMSCNLGRVQVTRGVTQVRPLHAVAGTVARDCRGCHTFEVPPALSEHKRHMEKGRFHSSLLDATESAPRLCSPSH